jgi:hypothetical protein
MIGLGGAPRVRDWSKVRLSFSGNSLAGGTGSANYGSNGPVEQLPLLDPISGAIAIQKHAYGGQSITQLDASAYELDHDWKSGSRNMFLFWEGTNSICNDGRTAAQALGDLQVFLANRLAINPNWKIGLLTALPRQQGPAMSGSQSDIDTFNQRLVDWNTGVKQFYRAFGAHFVVDVRQPGSPFNFPDYSPSTFALRDDLWSEPAGGRVHLTDAGYAVICRFIANALYRAPLPVMQP